MGKAPAFQFYVGDYLKDTRSLSLSAKGAWQDLLCYMWNAKTRGLLSKTWKGYSRMLGASVEDTKKAIMELIEEEVCDVAPEMSSSELINHGGKITIVSRRMVREARFQDSNKERQRKYREKGGGDPDNWTAIRVLILQRDEYMCAYCGRKADTVDHIIPKTKGGTEDPANLVACCKRCNMKKGNRTLKIAEMTFWKGFDVNKLTQNNTKITPPSSSTSSSSSTSKTKENKKRKKFLSNSFDIFWNAYPGTKTAKKKCLEKWLIINPDQKLFDKIMRAIQEQKTWRAKAKPNEFRPPWKNPLTWLNQECWNDEVVKTKPVARYKDVVCKKCKTAFKYNIDAEENMCPGCHGFYRKNPPPPKDPRVEALTAKAADSIGGME